MINNLSLGQKIFVYLVGLAFFITFAMFLTQTLNSGYKTYNVVFTSSVTGLKIGSIVTYKGVEIGSVDNIEIELPNADAIKVRIKVTSNFPMYSNYVASLGSQGFSGYSMIQISKDEKQMEQYLLEEGHKIQSIPSLIDNMSVFIPEFIDNVNNTLKRFNTYLDKKEIDEVFIQLKQTFANVEKTSKNLLLFSKSVKHSNRALKKVLQDISFLSKQFRRYDKEFNSEVFPNILKASTILKKFTDKVEKVIDKPKGVLRYLF